MTVIHIGHLMVKISHSFLISREKTKSCWFLPMPNPLPPPSPPRVMSTSIPSPGRPILKKFFGPTASSEFATLMLQPNKLLKWLNPSIGKSTMRFGPQIANGYLGRKPAILAWIRSASIILKRKLLPMSPMVGMNPTHQLSQAMGNFFFMSPIVI